MFVDVYAVAAVTLLLRHPHQQSNRRATQRRPSLMVGFERVASAEGRGGAAHVLRRKNDEMPRGGGQQTKETTYAVAVGHNKTKKSYD